MLRRAVRLSLMAEMVAIVTLDPQGAEVKIDGAGEVPVIAP
jgi:hypothetical protein